MPKKGKGKGPVYADEMVCLDIFGVKPGDFVLTPLGVQVQVIGMDKDKGLLFVEYPGGCLSPIEQMSKDEMDAAGYVKDKKTFYDEIMRSNRATEERLTEHTNRRTATIEAESPNRTLKDSPLMATSHLMNSDSFERLGDTRTEGTVVENAESSSEAVKLFYAKWKKEHPDEYAATMERKAKGETGKEKKGGKGKKKK
jgi:hypothetical protein